MADFTKETNIVKVVIRLVIILVLSCYILGTYSKYHFEFFNERSEFKNYTVDKIGVNKKLDISYNIYNGGIYNNYQNEYFIEYNAKFYQKNPLIMKVRNGISAKGMPFSDGVSMLNINIKNKNNKIVYKIDDIMKHNEVKKLNDRTLATEAMYLSKNKNHDLILNIPTRKKQYEFSRENKDNPYYIYEELKHSKVIEYNLNNKNITISDKNIKRDGKDIKLSDYNKNVKSKMYLIGNNTTMNVDKKVINKGYKSIVIYHGYEYYLAHKDAKIFKVFPELVKYLKKHHDKDQIVFDFKDSMSEKEIVEYLK